MCSSEAGTRMISNTHCDCEQWNRRIIVEALGATPDGTGTALALAQCLSSMLLLKVSAI